MKIKTLTFVAALCLGIGTVHAQIDKTITYQGVLTDSSGARVTGTVALALNIYKASGGSTIYTDNHASVDVANGLFTVVIGTGDGGAIALPFNEPYELGVTVDSGTELAPRTLLTAEPYALNAGGVNISGGNSGDVLTNDGNGNGAWGAPGAGPQGPQGKAGADGATGAAGAQGDPGPVGSEFWDGALGGNINNANSGNVGIGTTTPGAKLHIDGSAAKLKVSDSANYGGEVLVYTVGGTPNIDLVGHGGTASGGIAFRDGTHNQEWAIKTNAVVGTGLEFIDGNSTVVMNLAHGGNVGIGVNNPSSRLDVGGEIEISGSRLHVGEDGNVGIGTASPEQSLHIFRGSAGSVDAHSLSGFVLEDDTGLFQTFLAPANQDVGFFFGDPDSNTVGAIFYEHTFDKIKFRTHQSNKMTIDSDGNVGIGTESPSEKLHVDGSAAKLKISDSANFGGEVIAYTANGTPSIDLVSHGSTASGGIAFQDSAKNQEWAIKTNAIVGTGLEFIDGNSTVVMNLAHGGKVGIGTTSPGETLTLDAPSNTRLLLREGGGDKGRISAGGGGLYFRNLTGDMIFRNPSDADVVRIKGDGKVGIGTTTPSTRLEVAGGDLTVSDSSPNLLINDTAESANGRLWKIASDGGYLRIQATRDDQGSNGTFLEMFRSGAAASRTAIATRLGVGFTGAFSEALEVVGNVDASGTLKSGPYLRIDGTSPVGVISTPTSGGYALMIQSNGGRGDFDTGAPLRLNPAGDPVGIGTGTDAVTEMLVVNGNVKANDFISDTTTYPDYVFEADYSLMPLDELEAFIAREGHLPKIASEAEVRARGGVNLSELQIQLLEKIEELTLHTIALEKRINVLESE